MAVTDPVSMETESSRVQNLDWAIELALAHSPEVLRELVERESSEPAREAETLAVDIAGEPDSEGHVPVPVGQ